MPASSRSRPVPGFDLAPGREIGGKYAVDTLLGKGWEGEVYRVVEKRTGALRAAKLFFPERNPNNRAVDFYARKLERLRSCTLFPYTTLFRSRKSVV